MKHLFYAFIIFSSIIYYSIAALFGATPAEGEANPIYKYYCIIVFGLFIILYMWEYWGRKIRTRHFVSIIIVAFYFIAGLISGYSTSPSWLSFVAYCIPATGLAVYYSENLSLEKIVKWLDVFLPIASISLIFSFRSLMSSIIQGAVNYSQDLAYYSSYCFLFYLFLLLFGKQYQRFKIFSSKFYLFFSILMMPYSLAILFLSGGRGAFGTVIVGLFVLLYIYDKRFRLNKRLLFRYLLSLFVLVFVVSMFVPEDASDIFYQNSNRIFSFFNKTIDLGDRTSGRDDVFIAAVHQIKQKPIQGYGLFSYKELYSRLSGQGYPHNFFLEVLLQGGLLFFIVAIIAMLLFFVKLKYIIVDTRQMILLPFLIIPMTMLLYSGSYIENPFFWFSVMFVFNFKRKAYLTR